MRKVYYIMLIWIFLFVFYSLHQLKSGTKLRNSLAPQGQKLFSASSGQSNLKFPFKFRQDQQAEWEDPEVDPKNGKASAVKNSAGLSGSIDTIRSYYKLADMEAERPAAQQDKIKTPEDMPDMVESIKAYYNAVGNNP